RIAARTIGRCIRSSYAAIRACVARASLRIGAGFTAGDHRADRAGHASYGRGCLPPQRSATQSWEVDARSRCVRTSPDRVGGVLDCCVDVLGARVALIAAVLGVLQPRVVERFLERGGPDDEEGGLAFVD